MHTFTQNNNYNSHTSKLIKLKPKEKKEKKYINTTLAKIMKTQNTLNRA